MGWDGFGVCPGQAALKRLWVRSAHYDVLGEWKEVNLTEAGSIFQLGRRWLLVSSQTPDDGLLSRQPVFFSLVVFSQTSIRLALCEVSSLSLRPKFSHESVQLAQQGWRGHVDTSQKCEGAGPIPISRGTGMRVERGPVKHFNQRRTQPLRCWSLRLGVAWWLLTTTGVIY